MRALVNQPLPETVRFGREICGDLAQAEAVLLDGGWEWELSTNQWAGGADAALRLLEPVQDHPRHAGLGTTVSESVDGDQPHAPRAAAAQGRSVAGVLEAWWRLEQACRANRSAQAPDPVTVDGNAGHAEARSPV